MAATTHNRQGQGCNAPMAEADNVIRFPKPQRAVEAQDRKNRLPQLSGVEIDILFARAETRNLISRKAA